MSLGLESLTSELDKKETAFQSLPQSELMKKRKLAPTGGLPRSLTDALVAEKVLNDKAAAANSMAASMESNPRTIAQQNEAEIENQTQQEVLKATAGVLQNKANRIKSAQANRAMKQGMGITGAPVQRRQVAAQGGIVGYDNGGFVDTLKDAGSYLISGKDSLGGMSPAEAAAFGLAFIPGVGPVLATGARAALTGLRGLQLAKGAGMVAKGAQAVGRGARKGFTKPNPNLSAGLTPKKGILGRPDKTFMGPVTNAAPRVFSPMRTAQTAGGLGYIGSKLLKPGDSSSKLPDSTYDEVPNRPESEAPTSTGRSQAERDAALKRLLYTSGSAGFGLGNVSKAGREFDQQEFSKKIDQDTLTAKQELNKINSANVLQNRLTQVNAEIAALQEQLSNTPVNAELRDAKAAAIADPEDNNKQERVRLLQIKSAEELERYADPLGSGDVGLLVQRQQLQARINTIESSIMNDPMDAIVARNN